MNLEQFEQFLKQFPQNIISIIETELFGKLEPAIQKSYATIKARKIAHASALSLTLIFACEDIENSKIRLMSKKIIKKISNAIQVILDAFRLYYSNRIMLYQAWETIPTLEEIRTYLKNRLIERLDNLLKNSLFDMINKIVCGSDFETLVLSTVKSMFTNEYLIETTLGSVAAAWSAAEKL